MKRYGFIVLLFAVVGGSCSEMPMAAPDGMCNCATPTAAQVSYSNTTSHLTSTNVQGALDEVAAKPAEAPIGPRVYKKVSNIPSSTAVSAGGVAHCDDETHDLPIGGFCTLSAANVNAAIVSDGVTLVLPTEGTPQAGYSCSYQQPTAGNPLSIQITAICLR
jgi:hypothetical protein